MKGFSREYDHPRFSRVFFGETGSITVIGDGELGGKALGLSLADEVIRREFTDGRFDGLTVRVPHLTVIRTAAFDEFMELNGFSARSWDSMTDERIAHAFQQGEMPSRMLGDLRSLAQEVKTPLALRSSSLLEDAMYRPFAGVYGTKMIPNNQPSPDERFKKLVEAVKFVWSSAFFSSARGYLKAIGGEEGSEKMAVIVQEIVGRRSGNRFYPDVSGVGRSYNFYPTGSARAEQGIVELALGLGKTIVGGGKVWGFSPAYPKAPPPFNSLGDMLENTQRGFWAVNMGRPPSFDPVEESEYLVECSLEDADYDNALRFTASSVSSDTGRLVPGVGADGARLINFAPILEWGEIPLGKCVKELLAVFKEELGADVEIEFAMTLDRQSGIPAELGFLQVRPMVVADEEIEVTEEMQGAPGVLAVSSSTLGNGSFDDIRDILYIPPDQFDATRTPDLVADIGRLNAKLQAEGRRYLLIGFGRWGTSDRYCGIPVTWDQISGAQVIVEVSLEGASSDPSQGSHFFHNVTSLRVCYFTVPPSKKDSVDWERLAAEEPMEQAGCVRHLRLGKPLSILVDGRKRRGVVLIND